MAANNKEATLLSEQSKSSTDYTESEDMLNYKELSVTLRVTNVAGTSPTLDVDVQHSFDNSNWQTLKSFSQKTDVGDDHIYVPDGSSVYGFARYVRCKYTIGGTDPNFTFEITVVGKE